MSLDRPNHPHVKRSAHASVASAARSTRIWQKFARSRSSSFTQAGDVPIQTVVIDDNPVRRNASEDAHRQLPERVDGASLARPSIAAAPTAVPTAAEQWSVVAPFLVEADDVWISDFARSDRFEFTKVLQSAPEQSWHTKKVARTGGKEWVRFHDSARRALAQGRAGGGGVVTVFPQLAAACGLQKRLTRRSTPVVSWFFNTNLGDGAQRSIARWALSGVDRFVVHSTAEIEAYAHDLAIAEERFRFVPVQYGGDVQTHDEELDEPFVFATGSGFRDYGTLFEALKRNGLPAKVVAGERILAGLTVPPNVEVLEGQTRADIHRMMRQARVNVIPMTTDGLTAGIITIVETFHHGRGLVITRRSGIDDYVTDEVNALEVAPGASVEMADAIVSMWENESLRRRLGEGAAHFASTRATDEAAAAELVAILADLR